MASRRAHIERRREERTADAPPPVAATEETAPDTLPAPPAEPAGLVVVRVLGPGSVLVDGRLHGPGEELVMNADEARSFARHVQIVG